MDNTRSVTLAYRLEKRIIRLQFCLISFFLSAGFLCCTFLFLRLLTFHRCLPAHFSELACVSSHPHSICWSKALPIRTDLVRFPAANTFLPQSLTICHFWRFVCAVVNTKFGHTKFYSIPLFVLKYLRENLFLCFERVGCIAGTQINRNDVMMSLW